MGGKVAVTRHCADRLTELRWNEVRRGASGELPISGSRPAGGRWGAYAGPGAKADCLRAGGGA